MAIAWDDLLANTSERLSELSDSLSQRSHRGALHALPKSLAHDTIEIEQHIREGRFQRSLALIAGGAALLGGLEVSYEHIIGSYSQRIMYSPVIISGVMSIAGVWGAFDRRIARTLLPLSSAALVVDGALGFAFHIRGIQRKPGGWRLPITNIVMGPPLFAPLLLALSGMLGLIASGLRQEDSPLRLLPARPALPQPRWLSLLPKPVSSEATKLEREVREGRFQRALAAVTAISALLNGAEALYSHCKTNYAYPSQWLPVALSPVIAAAGFGAVASRRAARTALPAASLAALATGGVGFYFHARGVTRRTGGLKLPIYNVIYGPPIFAPLLYAATGFMGLLASLLRRER